MSEPLWVFGYGSLIWRPGFAAIRRRPALLRGLHRALCVISHVHRGTPDSPGLVVGLDHGGSCRGVAFQIASGKEAEVRDYLRSREQVTMVYREVTRRISFLDDSGGSVEALCFVADRRHHQYGKGLSFEEQVALICQGAGRSGRSIEYLEDMIACLDRLGIHDSGLARLHAAAIERMGQASSAQV